MPTKAIVLPAGKSNSSFDVQTDIIFASNGEIEINKSIFNVECTYTGFCPDSAL